MMPEFIIGGMVWGQTMVLLAAVVFACFDLAYVATGRRRQFLNRRRLGVAACATLLMLPLVYIYLAAAPGVPRINATDVLVSQYLKGNIGISASDMSWFLNLRTEIVQTLTAATSPVAQAVIAAVLAAMIGRVVYLAANAARILRAVRRSVLLRAGRRVRVVVSSTVAVPFSTRGLWRYYVVLPQSLCRDADAMRMALGHEMQHIRQGDVDAEVILSLLSPFVVLNPGFWFLSAKLRRLGELACDRACLSRRRFDPGTYALRLLSAARRARGPGQISAFGVPLVGRALPVFGRRPMLRDRIEEIARQIETPTRESRLFGFGLCGLMAVSVVLVALAFAKPTDWSHDRIMLSTIANLDRLNQINTMAQRSW